MESPCAVSLIVVGSFTLFTAGCGYIVNLVLCSLLQETMQILQYQAKGAHLNTVERYFIYKEFSNNNHLNDDSNIAPNKIFDALLKLQKP